MKSTLFALIAIFSSLYGYAQNKKDTLYIATRDTTWTLYTTNKDTLYISTKKKAVVEKFPHFDFSFYLGGFGALPLTNYKINTPKDFSEIEIVAKPGFYCAPSFNVYGKKIHAHVQYSIFDTSVVLVVGYLLKHHWDVYGMYSKNTVLGKDYGGQHVSLGIEKIIPSKRSEYLIFFEFEHDTKEDLGFSFGGIINIPFSRAFRE